MNIDLKEQLENYAIDRLMESSLGNKIQHVINIYEGIQKHLIALSKKEEDEKQTYIKTGTIITFSLLKKFRQGKTISNLSNDDWKDIANDVSEYVVFMEEQQYVQFVFRMYENFIRASVDIVAPYSTDDTMDAIYLLADELAYKTDLLNNNEIDEVKYIEDCLWISLEAMIKLTAAMTAKILDEDYTKFAQALSMYAFEYGRYKLYSKELEILNEYIEAQHRLDEKLEKKYEEFLKELEVQSQQFYAIIDNAFTDDFRTNFLHSVILAQSVGVDSSEVLSTIKDVDDYFM